MNAKKSVLTTSTAVLGVLTLAACSSADGGESADGEYSPGERSP